MHGAAVDCPGGTIAGKGSTGDGGVLVGLCRRPEPTPEDVDGG
jgi:hypothetical protein